MGRPLTQSRSTDFKGWPIFVCEPQGEMPLCMRRELQTARLQSVLLEPPSTKSHRVVKAVRQFLVMDYV